MKIARVIGNVVSTAKHPAWHGYALMLVCPEGPDGARDGATFIAIDRVQAGPGDRVLVLREGGGVRQLLKTPDAPIRSLIVGIVDRVTVGGSDVDESA